MCDKNVLPAFQRLQMNHRYFGIEYVNVFFFRHFCYPWLSAPPTNYSAKWPKAAAGDKLAFAVVADTTSDSILGAPNV